MKIVQLSPYFYPHLGGVESHVLELSKHLQKRGHEILVITTQLEGTESRSVVEGVTVKRIEPISIMFSTPIVPSVKNILRDMYYDILHSHLPPPLMTFFGLWGIRNRDIPSVLTYHCDLEIPHPFGPLLVNLYERTLGTYSVSKADKIITTTATYGATSRAVWYRDADIIPNAVDPERFHPRNSGKKVRERHEIDPDHKVVMYVGRLVYHKGLEYLVRSAKYLDDDTRHLIVGTGDFKPELERIVKDEGLEEKVIFAGRVSNEDLPYYYGATDVFVLPSVSRLEAFGIVTLEAMASEVPVVVSDIPGVREVITEGRNGLVAEPMNPQDIAGKIRLILENPEVAKRMGKKGRERVLENFTWDIVAENIEKVYEELLGDRLI
ncbi:MAG: glycosyltransferase family 4 protein [Candidatus Saliniplasma sp.]